jgi:archaemetzincin
VKFIYVLPLGNPDRKLLAGLVPAVWESLRIPVEVRECPIELDPFYDEGRGQYNSTAILQHLKQHPSIAQRLPLLNTPGNAALLAVVPHDLFIPILTFVFGEAELGGTAAVVSYHRLENERYGLPADRELLSRRLQKEALHELGHTLGLLHCPEQACVMRSSTNVDEIDLKGVEFCAECRSDMQKSHPRTGRRGSANP